MYDIDLCIIFVTNITMYSNSYARKIDEITRQRDARSDDFDGMVQTGKDLVSKKDVTDTAPVKDKIKVSGGGRCSSFRHYVLIKFRMIQG